MIGKDPARYFFTSNTPWWIGSGLLIVASMCYGCVPDKVQVRSARQFNPNAISSVAVLPFHALKTPQWSRGPSVQGLKDPEEIRTQFRLPGTDQYGASQVKNERYEVSATAAQRITSYVISALEHRPGLRVVVPSKNPDENDSNNTVNSQSFAQKAREAGQQLKVDGVIMGLVRTYRQREGSKLGAKPAAVGFEVYLIRPEDGLVLWKGEFYEEQKPLNEDVVGFFEKGGGFVTAEELAEIGVRKVMKQFPVGLRASTAVATPS